MMKENNSLEQLIRGNAEAIKGVTAMITNLSANFVGIKDEMVITKNDIAKLSDRMFTIEQNEEITSDQCDTITASTKTRITQILGNDELVRAKYYKLFSSRLYSDARKYAGLGSRIARTKKRDFQRILDFIESWNPDGGSVKLKAYGDKLAKARVKARKMGY